MERHRNSRGRAIVAALHDGVTAALAHLLEPVRREEVAGLPA